VPGRSSQRHSASRPASRLRTQKDGCVSCLPTFENLARERGFHAIAGIDEVGRGALFGPVFAAAVILDPDRPIVGLQDSKTLDPATRTSLAEHIRHSCVAWALGAADAYEIDRINIYQASRLAMKRAAEALAVPPDYLLIDAVSIDFAAPQEPLIKGDARCQAIAAASIVAKVARDQCMDHWHLVFPQYHLSGNKGYGTPDHKRALAEHGPTSLHRFSYAPVRASCAETWWTGYVPAASPVRTSPGGRRNSL
jgi:ribonuclease HII